MEFLLISFLVSITINYFATIAYTTTIKAIHIEDITFKIAVLICSVILNYILSGFILTVFIYYLTLSIVRNQSFIDTLKKSECEHCKN